MVCTQTIERTTPSAPANFGVTSGATPMSISRYVFGRVHGSREISAVRYCRSVAGLAGRVAPERMFCAASLRGSWLLSAAPASADGRLWTAAVDGGGGRRF